MKVKAAFLIIFLTAFSFPIVFAQVIPPSSYPEPPPPTEQTILPVLGYTSDYGFFGGGFYQRISFDHDMPFSSELTLDVIASTKGDLMSGITYQRLQTFGKPVRSRIRIDAERQRNSGYYGIGNETDFQKSLRDDDVYFFENRNVTVEFTARKKITEISYLGQVDVFGLGSVAWGNGISDSDETLFAQERPAGFDSSWMNKLGFGFLADSRDSEFLPANGVRHEIELANSNSLIGSDYSNTTLRADLRHYTKLLPGVVLAHKFQYERIMGDAPYWGLSIIGSKDGLRGFYENRFRGDSSILSMLEIRSWLFGFLDDQVRVGIQGFWDTGRVFSEFDSNRIFDDWKQSYGIGGAISVFDTSLIIRGDIGFSNESTRIYFGTGYIF